MPTPVEPNAVAALNQSLSVSKQNYDACIDVVQHQHVVAGLTATTRLHHLKFNANGQPMIEELAVCLVRHIISYCLTARNRPSTFDQNQAVEYTQRARKLFVHPAASQEDPDRTGEAGEILLYFLMEAVLGAPQVVAKMDLKTNPNLEVNGSDGIHMKWSSADKVVDVFFGESKLYVDVGAALTAALRSVENFHSNGMRQHEYALVTTHFKHADESVKLAVKDVLDAGVPGTARINHACLIGYNWDEFPQSPQQAQAQLTADFRARYLADAHRLHQLLQQRFDNFTRKTLRFEVFFLPFVSVQSFRDAFNIALG